MNVVTGILLGMAIFFGLIFMADRDNPCSQFGQHQERCSQGADE
jgi:hypothetical protein